MESNLIGRIFGELNGDGTCVTTVDVLDVMDLLYFVIHCLWTLDLAFFAARCKGAKD